jgi:flagellar motility protein MotE (MotC chaperone)
LIVLFVVLPVLILGSVYYFSDPFKDKVNSVAANVPGPMGDYFGALPTADEVSDQIKTISDYMLSVETQRAVDKMLVIKSEDEVVYNQVIKGMLRLNPNRTELILEEIRRNTVKKDLIANTIDQIGTESTDDLTTQADYLKSISTSTAIEEMKKITSSSINGYKDLAKVLSVMDPVAAAELMKFLDEGDFSKTMQYIDKEKANLIKTEMVSAKSRKNELKSIAEIYSTDNIEKLVDVIGNTNTYTIQELSVLYKELGSVKSGQILSKVADDAFIFSLMNNIKESEILENGEDKITKDILNSLKIHKDFDDNIIELTNIYVKMSSDKVASLIKNLVRNSSDPKIYTLENGENIVITDEDLALGILNNFTQSKVSEILGLLDDNLASDLSKKMTLPK